MQLTRMANLLLIGRRGQGLLGGAGGTFNQAVEISAHQLGAIALRHIAGEGHGAGLFVDAHHGAHNGMVGLTGRIDPQREQQRAAGKLVGIFAEIALVQIQRGLAIQLIKNIFARLGDMPLRAEHVSAATASEGRPVTASP